MTEAAMWWAAAGVAVALELATGTFYLLMLAIGLAAGAVAAHLGLGLAGQLVAAALVGGAATLLLRQWRKSRPLPAPAEGNRDVNLDIGQTLQVSAWQPDGIASVHYRGAAWTAQWRAPAGASAPTAAPAPGLHRIAEIQGNRLVLEPA